MKRKNERKRTGRDEEKIERRTKEGRKSENRETNERRMRRTKEE